MSLSLSMRGLAMSPKSSSAVVPPAGFAFQPETTAWAAQVVTNGGAAVSNRRMMGMDNAFKQAKAIGAFSNILQWWVTGTDQPTTLTSLRSPGTRDLTFTGASVFIANTSIAGGAGKRLNLNVFLDELSPSNMMVGFYGTQAAGTGLPEFGATDATGNGCKLIGRTSATNVASGFLGNSTEVTFGASTDVDGSGWEALNRTSAASYDFWKGGRKVVTQPDAAFAGPFGHVEITSLAINNNGTYVIANKPQFGGIVARGLTDDQMIGMAAIMQQLQDTFFFGEIDQYPVGFVTSPPAYDVVIYGSTSGGINMAFEAKRRGLSVAIVRSPMEGNIGGMTGNGLGQFDWITTAQVQGLCKWMLTKAGASNVVVESMRYERACRSLIDPRITGIGLDIPVYDSTGIASVTSHMVSTDRYIDSFTTIDGRTFTWNQGWADCSYEGDLAFAAGCTMTYGRDAAGTGVESNSGVTAITSAFGSVIDPWITPTVPASGYAQPFLIGRADVGFPTIGSADTSLMRPNYRMTVTNSPLRRRPFSTTKPLGYDALGGNSMYEPLARAFQAGLYTTLGQIMKFSATGTVSIDINSLGGWSTDLPGMMDGYLQKNTADRLTVWDNVATYDQGLIWWILNSGDSRIPSGIITSLAAYGWDMYAYTRPARANRVFNEPQEMYVRSGYRMVSNFILNANDVTMVDGTTPRSTNTVAIASYQIDDHGPNSWAYLAGGTTWSIGNEGQQNIPTGGVNQYNPIPLEIYLPKRTEAANGVVMYAASVTSLAYGNVRMEGTFMLASQFMGFLWAEKKASAVAAVQDVSYANARTAALAGTLLLTTGATETVPNLPQVN